MADSNFLDGAYEHPGESSAEYYDRWAATYDDELEAQAYATPRRCAEALAAAGADPAAPVLDYGCGTGLSGVALSEAGFSVIDGWDPSEKMLEAARARGLYRDLVRIDPTAPPPEPEAPYPAIVAAGVIGPNVAPPETIDALLRALPSGGLFVLSLNDHALADPAFEVRATEWIDCGQAELLARDYGDHIPGIGLGAAVLTLRRR